MNPSSHKEKLSDSGYGSEDDIQQISGHGSS